MALHVQWRRPDDIDTDLKGAAALAALKARGKLFAYPHDVAAVMERDLRTIYDGIKRGEIPHTRIGQRYQVPVAWLRRQVDGLDTPEQARESAGMTIAPPSQLTGRWRDHFETRLESWFLRCRKISASPGRRRSTSGRAGGRCTPGCCWPVAGTGGPQQAPDMRVAALPLGAATA